MALWEKYGLAAPGWFRSHAEGPDAVRLSRATRLCRALEEGGGLFANFGQFLSGRADLLPSAYLYELRKSRLPENRSLRLFLQGEQSDRISGPEWIRSAPGSEAFYASYQGRRIVIEAYTQEPGVVFDKSWENFSRSIRVLAAGPEEPITRASVLIEFREWLRLHADIERKRSILTNLHRKSVESVSRFPRLIPELQSPSWLVYEAMEGAPVDQDASPEPTRRNANLEVFSEGILEQALLFSLVDADGQMENYLLLSDGTLGFRVLPAWHPIPAEWHHEIHQYLTASSSGNTKKALQMLCRISSGRETHTREQELLNHLSSLQPELKLEGVTPESITMLENYWRALALSSLDPPLFLQLFHRNLILLGQYNERIAPSTDLIAEALWPVSGRVLRFQFGEILSISDEEEKNWIFSASLLFLAAARQVTVALERLRDDRRDVTASVDFKHDAFRQSQLNRRTASLVRSAIALGLFLFSLQLALSSTVDPSPLLAKAAATAAAAALTFSVAGIK